MPRSLLRTPPSCLARRSPSINLYSCYIINRPFYAHCLPTICQRLLRCIFYGLRYFRNNKLLPFLHELQPIALVAATVVVVVLLQSRENYSSLLVQLWSLSCRIPSFSCSFSAINIVVCLPLH